MNLCIVCRQFNANTEQMCQKCWMMINPLSTKFLQKHGNFCIGDQKFPGLSLWLYSGIIRDLILAFKVERTWSASTRLFNLSLKDDRIENILWGVDAIMSTPSSLWSRLRGRFDLAALFGRSLGVYSGIPFKVPPSSLWGSMKKQALLPSYQRRLKEPRSNDELWDHRFFDVNDAWKELPKCDLCILVVDDVVTTGHTLTEFSNNFRNIRFRFLTLATAARIEAGDGSSEI